MSQLLEGANLSMGNSPDLSQEEGLLQAPHQPFFENLKGAFSRAVEYVGDTLSTPGRKLTAGLALAGSVLASAGAVAPVAAEAQSAGIVAGQSIGGIKLGESGAQVKQLLGQPTAGQISGGYLQYYPPSAFNGEIYFDAQGKVDGMLTGSSHFKTSKGNLHVDSPLSAVHKAYPKAQSKQTSFGSEYVLKSNYAGQSVLTVFHSAPGKKTISGIEVDFKSAVPSS